MEQVLLSYSNKTVLHIVETFLWKCAEMVYGIEMEVFWGKATSNSPQLLPQL